MCCVIFLCQMSSGPHGHILVLQIQWGTKDGLIFLIDASKNMFEDSGEEENAFAKCIKVNQLNFRDV